MISVLTEKVKMGNLLERFRANLLVEHPELTDPEDMDEFINAMTMLEFLTELSKVMRL